MSRSILGLILFFFCTQSIAMGAKPNPAMDEVPNFEPAAVSHYITRPDGIQIHYTTMGEGTPVFLIHGYYATGDANWYMNGIAQELSKTNKVIAMDQRGHGKSDRPHVSWAYGDKMWQDAIAVLDDAGVETAHIHGYSMGGSILTQILYHAPERVLSAVYGGAGIREYDVDELEKIKEDKKITEEIEEEEDEAEEAVIELTDPDHLALYALRQNPPMKGEDKKIDLTTIEIPVLAINGEYDSPHRRTHRLERQLKDFRNIIVPDKGHLGLVTPGFMPEQYLNDVVGFIQEQNAKEAKAGR